MVTEAKRGHIYRFDDSKNSYERYVLVVSSNTRATDRIVSVIMFGDSFLGHDVVKITSEEIGVKYLHCGMLTYTKREFLVEEIGQISTEELKAVENTLCHELSIREDVVAELNFYKDAYENLLDRLVSTGLTAE